LGAHLDDLQFDKAAEFMYFSHVELHLKCAALCEKVHLAHTEEQLRQAMQQSMAVRAQSLTSVHHLDAKQERIS